MSRSHVSRSPAGNRPVATVFWEALPPSDCAERRGSESMEPEAILKTSRRRLADCLARAINREGEVMNRNALAAAVAVFVLVLIAYLIFWGGEEDVAQEGIGLDEEVQGAGALPGVEDDPFPNETREIPEDVEDLMIEPGEVDPVPETAVEEQELLEDPVDEEQLEDPLELDEAPLGEEAPRN